MGTTRWWRGALAMQATLTWLASPAFSNGNYSHVWVATDSLPYLGQGELRDLLTQPDPTRGCTRPCPAAWTPRP